MIAATLLWFDETHIKQLGAAIFLVLVGYALGNHHKTEEALAGQATYFKAAEVKHVEAVASKVATGVRAEDAKAVGVSAPVLKATVDAAKVTTAH